MFRILYLLAATSLVAECSPYDRFLSSYHRPLTQDPKMAEVANILKGILTNLTKHKGYLNQMGTELKKQLPKDLVEYIGTLDEAGLQAVADAVPVETSQKQQLAMALKSVVVHKA